MSQRKLLLRVLAVVSALVGTGMLSASLLVRFGPLQAKALETPLMFAFPSVFVMLFVTIRLEVEFIRATRVNKSWMRRSEGLNGTELSALVRCCPRWLLVASLGLAIVAIVAVLPGGEVSWNFSESITRDAAVGLGAGSALFNLLSVPVIASASRMAGTFSDQQDAQEGRAAKPRSS
jgi:hypothetical protein